MIFYDNYYISRLYRCSGATAGLGHLEVGWNTHTAQITPRQ
jgi:hypothetical protein